MDGILENYTVYELMNLDWNKAEKFRKIANAKSKVKHPIKNNNYMDMLLKTEGIKIDVYEGSHNILADKSFFTNIFEKSETPIVKGKNTPENKKEPNIIKEENIEIIDDTPYIESGQTLYFQYYG